MDVDQPRYLGRIGYVETSARAVDGLECVSSEVQQAITQRARLDELRRMRQAWSSTEEAVQDALTEFERLADPRLRAGVRGVAKATRRLSRQVERLGIDDE